MIKGGVTWFVVTSKRAVVSSYRESGNILFHALGTKTMRFESIWSKYSTIYSILQHCPNHGTVKWQLKNKAITRSKIYCKKLNKCVILWKNRWFKVEVAAGSGCRSRVTSSTRPSQLVQYEHLILITTETWRSSQKGVCSRGILVKSVG